MFLVEEELLNKSDIELYQRMSEGSREGELAFMELYRRYAGRVFAYCLRFLGNKSDAKDIFQETFVRFYESTKIERTMTNVSAFLIKIARNLCLNFKKSMKQTSTIEDYMKFENAYDIIEKDELLNLIKIALNELPDDYREVFILREYQGMSYSEIAEILGISVPNVKVRIFRAKTKIREILSPYISELTKSKG